MTATAKTTKTAKSKAAETRVLTGRDDRAHPQHGPCHAHACRACNADILCVRGPDCQLQDGDMHCCMSCFSDTVAFMQLRGELAQ